MNQNQMAADLERDLSKWRDQSGSPGQSGGGGGVNMHIAAHSGGTVNAPTFIGCNISGPLAINSGGTPMTIQGGQTITRSSLKLKLQEHLKKRFSVVHQESRVSTIEDIYTELHIVKGRTGGVNWEHEVAAIDMRQIGTIPSSGNEQVTMADIFREKSARKVLTLGIAGVGKTVAVQKFVMDWAQEKSNQDIDFVFVLLFRELNLKVEECCSLVDLLVLFYPDLKDLKSFPDFFECKVLFVFDGLDESRLQLNFDKWVSDPDKKSSLDILITSVIKGMLLSNTLIWVTTRPAAASLIPENCFNLLTEVRGFNDDQKIIFFQKNIRKRKNAKRIIDHIKKNRSLHIMCHIPVFCHIIASVQNELVGAEGKGEAAKTLTEMYALYSVSQIKKITDKYSEKMSADEKGQFLVPLGKLAFRYLEQGNLIFYEKDLQECDININSGALKAGVCTQIFNVESAATGENMYSFVHLSVQEFLAALYVLNENATRSNPLVKTLKEKISWLFRHSTFDLYRFVIEKALQSEKGQLDLFVRFLLGLAPMLKPGINSSLHVLLPHLCVKEEIIDKTVQYIKEKIRTKDVSSERIINLFHCLSELEDNSLVDEINRYINSDEKKNLTPAQCSALSYMLLMSAEDLEEFDLKKYLKSEEGLHRMLPVVKVSKRVWLNQCHLSKVSCRVLLSALQRTPSHLRLLDMSDNDLHDEGVELLCVGLRDPQCKLEKLRLSGCLITHKGCSLLASALKSNPSYMKELDLSYNHPGDSGIGELKDKVKDLNCKLKVFRYEHGGEHRIKPGLKKYACELTLDPNTAYTLLSLSEGNRKVTVLREMQSYPDHPERFNSTFQVLCGEGLSGRCYWEAEWSGGAAIAMAYKSIQRKGGGDDSELGHNAKSWSLKCSRHSYSAWYNDNETEIPAPSSRSSRVGVYLDWPAGTLSFYSVSSDTLTHLHTFHSTFTEPLYPGFWVINDNSSVILCQLT